MAVCSRPRHQSLVVAVAGERSISCMPWLSLSSWLGHSSVNEAPVWGARAGVQQTDEPGGLCLPADQPPPCGLSHANDRERVSSIKAKTSVKLHAADGAGAHGAVLTPAARGDCFPSRRGCVSVVLGCAACSGYAETGESVTFDLT